MEVKEQIISTLRATKRENIEKVIEYMTRNGFFSVSCHRHHKYTGGLADHAWEVYQLAIKTDAKDPSTPVIDKNSIAICALLHDFCKCYGMRHIEGHGRRSAKMIQELGVHLSSAEYLAIRFHMNLEKHHDHYLYPDAKKCRLRAIVNHADGRSARAH